MEVNGRKVLLKIRTGSHLYGTSTPESDEDFVGVFVPNPEDILGLQDMKEIDLSTKNSGDERRNTKDDVDIKFYSIGKFLSLLLQNNPNILELLFADKKNIVHMDNTFAELFDYPEKFVSQKVFHSFGGYAYSQRAKLVVKKERYGSLCEGVEWIKTQIQEKYLVGDGHVKITPVPISEEFANILNSKLIYYKGEKNNTEHFHKGMDLRMIYEKLTAERDRYGWRVKTDSFEKVGYDVKFGYHLVRLMMEGTQLLDTGKIEFPLGDLDRSLIDQIRNCEISYDRLLGVYDLMNVRMEQVNESTSLPKKPDWKWANEWLIDFQREHIVRESRV